jgi:hypothetical protein
MIESFFTDLYPEMNQMRKTCFHVMRGTETLGTQLLSDDETETLRMLSDKWIKEFDKYKNNLVDDMKNELKEL